MTELTTVEQAQRIVDDGPGYAVKLAQDYITLQNSCMKADALIDKLHTELEQEQQDNARLTDERDQLRKQVEALKVALEALMDAVNADQSQLDKSSNFDSAYAIANKAIAAVLAWEGRK